MMVAMTIRFSCPFLRYALCVCAQPVFLVAAKKHRKHRPTLHPSDAVRLPTWQQATRHLTFSF
jgi:hypothetical protein